MVAQLKEFKACYSKTYGLLTASEFEDIYKKKMKVIRMKSTIEQRKTIFFLK
jgi:hypothetical protein